MNVDQHCSSEAGFLAPLLAILLFLLLAVGVIVGVVVGMDKVVQNQDPTKSVFSDDAKIKPILNDLREKKERFVEKVEQRIDERIAESEQSLQPQNPKNPAPSGSKNDAPNQLGSPAQNQADHHEDALADVQRRLDQHE